MKLLFCQGGSRIKTNSKGEYYVDGNFNDAVFEDYYALSEEVTFLLRADSKKYTDDELKKRFNKLKSKFKIELLPDVYNSLITRFNLWTVKKAKSKIKKLVEESDKIIIRSIGNFYTNAVLAYCKKLKKDYLIEVTGFAFEGTWYHSLKGKFLALYREAVQKKALRNAPHAVYVTEHALQKRYPCYGDSLGCSDVRIAEVSPEPKISFNLDNLKLCTVAFYDVKWKGQRDVIKALSLLKKKFNRTFQYYLIGSGTGKSLKKLVHKFGLEDQVHFLGGMSHKEVFEHLRMMDVYIQPSYQEGLCRAIVEAMSVGLPVVCSDAGGNYELIDQECIYPIKKVNVLKNKLLSMTSDLLTEQSRRNLEKAKKFDARVLCDKRKSFYEAFVRNGSHP